MGNLEKVFDPGALEANRQGHVTLKQRLSLAPSVLGAGLFFVLAAGSAGWIVSQLIDHRALDLSLVLIFGVVFPLIMLGTAYAIGGRPLIDLLQGQAQSVEGEAQRGFMAVGTRSGTNLQYTVGSETLQVDSFKTWESLPEWAVVRAYYAPFSKMLVNYEVLRSGSKE